MLCDCFLGSPALPQRKTLLSIGGSVLLIWRTSQGSDIEGSRQKTFLATLLTKDAKQLVKILVRLKICKELEAGEEEKKNRPKHVQGFHLPELMLHEKVQDPAGCFALGSCQLPSSGFLLQNRFCFQQSMKYVPHYGSLELEAHMACGTKIPGWCQQGLFVLDQGTQLLGAAWHIWRFERNLL